MRPVAALLGFYQSFVFFYAAEDVDLWILM